MRRIGGGKVGYLMVPKWNLESLVVNTSGLDDLKAAIDRMSSSIASSFALPPSVLAAHEEYERSSARDEIRARLMMTDTSGIPIRRRRP